MRIVGYTITNHQIINSDEECRINPPYLEFLLEPKEDTLKVFYHMGLSIANLINLIGITYEQARRLNSSTELFIPPYTIRYVQGKFFSIYKGDKTAFFNDISQYKTFTSEDYEKSPIEQVKIAKEIGERVLKSFEDIGLHPTTITSPIATYEKAVLDKLDIPTIDDMPEEAGLYAYNCCKNNWVETYRLGHFKHAYEYDINSAYPYQIMHLPDIRLGRWEKSKEIHQSAFYGYYKCRADIQADFHPFNLTVKNDTESRNYTVTGEREDFFTLSQLFTMSKENLGTYQILDGWNWIPSIRVTAYKELWNQLSSLYLLKQGADNINDKYLSSNIKRIMAGIYGKFLQQDNRNGQFGKWFNPVYAAEIECMTQLKVYHLCKRISAIPISITVDGALLPQYIPLYTSNRIGDWRLNGDHQVLSIGSGTVAVQNNKGDGDFSLDYDWIVDQIKKDPEAIEYTMEKLSPITLSTAMSQNKWKHLGQTYKLKKIIDIQYEEKRCYQIFPKNGGELLNNQFESEPWDISILSRR